MQEKLYNLIDTHSTYTLGKKLAAQLMQTPALIFLSGDLGAGKTTFAQGMIETLVAQKTSVLSPTYSYVQCYRGQLPIYHFDLYRIADVASIDELGLREQLDDENALRLVEWPERLAGTLRIPDLHIMLSHEKNGRKALIKYFAPFFIIP